MKWETAEAATPGTGNQSDRKSRTICFPDDHGIRLIAALVTYKFVNVVDLQNVSLRNMFKITDGFFLQLAHF